MGLHFKIDTKGICFLCLSPHLVQENNPLEHEEGSVTAFKMLIRYLKVDVKAIVAKFSVNYVTADSLQLSLCEDCSSVANDFLELFQSLEGIRLQLDLCVRQLHEFMEKADKDSDRLREYKRRLNTGKLEDLISSLMVDDLRKEMIGKVSRKVTGSVPRLILEKSEEKRREGSAENSQLPLQNWTKCVGVSEPVVVMESDVIDIKPIMLSSFPIHLQANNIPQTQNRDRISSNFEDRDSTPVVIENCNILSESLPYNKTEQVGNLECVFCRAPFPQQNQLLAHHFRTHVMSILSEKCLLPSGILISQLAPALEDILRQLDSQISQFGQQGHHQSNEDKEDLSMPQLTQMEEEELSLENRSNDSIPPVLSPQQDTPRREPSSRKSKSWKCVSCRKWFSEEDTFIAHQLQVHKVTASKDKKEDKKKDSSSIKASEDQMRKEGTSKKVSLSSTTGHHYKCSSCGKQLPSQLHLKIHYAKDHLASQSQAQWKCDRCDKCFSRQDSLRIHVICLHPLEHFSERLTPGVTVIEQEFRDAVGVMIGKSRKITTKSRKNPKSRRIRCLHCGNTFVNPRYLRVHLACTHFDKVMEKLRKG